MTLSQIQEKRLQLRIIQHIMIQKVILQQPLILLFRRPGVRELQRQEQEAW